MPDKNNKRPDLIRCTDDLIAAAEYLGYDIASHLLKMARIEFMLQLNEISDHELQSFARRLAVRAGQEPAAVIGIGRPTARTSAERKGRQPRKLRRTSSPDEL